MSFADAGAMPILEPLDLVRLTRMTKVWIYCELGLNQQQAYV